MKMRKYLVMLVIVAMTAALLAIPAIAGTLGPLDWDDEFGNADQQKAWMLKDWADWQQFQIITVEFADNANIEGADFDVINNCGLWAEARTTITPEIAAAKKLVINVAEDARFKYSEVGEDADEFKIGFAFWGEGGWLGANVKSISYTSASGGAAAVTPGGGAAASGNPKTGVETYIIIALGALALAAAGAVVFARKAKAQ
jgi:LPXTG-motif cell wall-anchored protein